MKYLENNQKMKKVREEDKKKKSFVYLKMNKIQKISHPRFCKKIKEKNTLKP